MCEGGSEEKGYPWVWSIWVKAPILHDKDLLIASACLPYVNPELFRKLAEGKTVLLACPERESPAHYGKIANIIRSSRPRSITIVTIDGSPHCFMLHASVNSAEYILGEKVRKKHYVVVNGEELVEINPDAVRVARYLHIVSKLVKEHPEVLQMLENVSLEYKLAENLRK